MSLELQFNLLIDPTWNDINNRPPRSNMMSDEAYVAAVQHDIAIIKQNPVGFEVLDRLRRWNRVVRVTPVREPQGVYTSPSADFGENKDLFWNREVSPFLNKYLGMRTRQVWAVVFYTPGAFDPGGTGSLHYQKDLNSNYIPNRQEVFVHELVHAIRFMSRTHNPNSVSTYNSNLRDYDGIEEFIAILVQNMFQSVSGGKLRENHHGFRELDSSLTSSFEFFKVSTQSFAAVEAFVKQNKFFTSKLGRLDVPFNPVRAFLTNPNKCREFAGSETAQARDAGPLAVLFSIFTPGVSPASWRKILSKT